MDGLDGRLLAQLVFDLVDDGVHLAGIGGGGDNEVVGHADEIAHFLHHDVGGLLLVGGLGGDERALARGRLGRAGLRRLLLLGLRAPPSGALPSIAFVVSRSSVGNGVGVGLGAVDFLLGHIGVPNFRGLGIDGVAALHDELDPIGVHL